MDNKETVYSISWDVMYCNLFMVTFPNHINVFQVLFVYSLKKRAG